MTSKYLSYLLYCIFFTIDLCNAQTLDYTKQPRAEDYYPSLKFQQIVSTNIIAGLSLNKINYFNIRELDSTGYLHYGRDRKLGGPNILYGLPELGCYHSPLKVELITDKYLWYPRANIELYSVYYNINLVDLYCLDGKVYSFGSTHDSGNYYLVGYDSLSQEYIYISGFLYKHRIAKDFQNLQISNPESDTLMNFIKLKVFDLKLSNLKYVKTENGYLIYEGSCIGLDKEYNPTVDWRIKVKIDDIDIVTYELLKVHNEDLIEILPIENTKKKKKK